MAIFVFIAVLLIDLFTDYQLWKHKKPINHTRGSLLRLIGLAPCVILLRLSSTPLIFFLYWTLFDGLFNIIRKQPFWSTGTNDPDDALTDNFLQQLSLKQHMIVKLGGIAISFIFYIIW